MTRSFPASRRIELLLHTASGPLPLRRSLLEEASEELGGMPGLVSVKHDVKALLDAIERGQVDEADYERRLSSVLAELAHEQSTARGVA